MEPVDTDTFRVSFTCPRCNAAQERDFDEEVFIRGVTADAGPADAMVPLDIPPESYRRGAIYVTCDCGRDHEGREEGTGCGYSAVVTLGLPP